MRLSAAYINQLAGTTGFDPANLEKTFRLKQLLAEFHRHAFLGERLVLKGGTALNLFYLDLPRLSVDIELNYIGQIDRGLMVRDRPEVETAVYQVCRGLGYHIQRGTDEHALLGLYLGFVNCAGRLNQIEMEINFLMRACALPAEERTAVRLRDEPVCEFRVLAIEELLAEKVRVMIERKRPRDLYDLFRCFEAGLAHNAEILRKLSVLFCVTLDRDFRDYQLEPYVSISQPDLDGLLYPLLRATDRPSADEMLQVVRPILETVLDHSREEAFLTAMAAGRYEPEFLFPQNPEIVSRIRQHPALVWKAGHVAKFLSGRSTHS